MDSQSLFLVFRGVSIGLVSILLVQSIRSHRRLPTGRWFIAFLLGLLAYLTVPLSFLGEDHWWIDFPLELMATAIPALFWFFCLSLFLDQHSPLPQQWVLAFFYMGLSVAGYAYRYDNTVESTLVAVGTFYVPQALKLLVLFLGLWAILKNWRGDLVETRRRARVGLMTLAGIYIAGVIVGEMILGRGLHTNFGLEAVNSAGIAVIIFIVTLYLIDGGLEGLISLLPREMSDRKTTQTGSELSTTKSPVNSQWIERLHRLMEDERAYRENGLTIGKLATKMDLQEYQLRRLINQQLGFRNFNDYLNSLRLEESARRLVDPAELELPILTIALDSGYSSINPFNRAFKAQFQVTPSQYRRENLKKSQ